MKSLSLESPKWLRVPINVLTRVTCPAHPVLLGLIIPVISDENINWRSGRLYNFSPDFIPHSSK
jgi:hypothetical protein